MTNKRFISYYSEDIVSQLSQNETGKRQYYRPVYSLHKWWARRPGALFRSIILSATNSSDNLFQISYDGSISQNSEYFKSHRLDDVIVLDPFMGGGTTLVEANRLGAKVVGCDINPVSYWIVRETLKPIDLDKLDIYFHDLATTVGERIKSLYKTQCLQCNSFCDSIYVFWLRFVKCPYCGENAYLYKRTLLNEGLSRNRPISRTNPAMTFCPQCFKLNNWDGNKDCSCQSCGAIYDPRSGTYNQGYFTCLNCDQSHISLIKTLSNNGSLQERLLSIEYWCKCSQNRQYKSPDTFDFDNINRIEKMFIENQETLVFPKQKILEGESSHRWRMHKYQHYYQLFNARQILAFNYLIEGIKSIPEEEYRNAFITIFSNSLEYNNLMTPYNFPHRKLHHLFNYHAMPLTTTPVENVVWGIGNEGAGTFVNCYQRYFLAKKYCQKPFDKYKDSRNSVQTVYAEGERISANFVESFQELKSTDKGVLLLCGDSTRLPIIPDQSVDFVITDPPYLDSIHYSELSNFFYVWLKCLSDEPFFYYENVPTEQEAIVNNGMDKNEEEYQKLLSDVFQECKRVLKDDGKLIFTFHHTKRRAWWIVLRAIVDSGFHVIDSFPVMSEYKVNPHIRDKQALDMDLVLVCQKRTSLFTSIPIIPQEVLDRALEDLLLHKLNKNYNRLFLYFMGELLKTASSITEKKIDYNWFTDVLAHFDEYLENNLIFSLDKDSFIKIKQLRLFEESSSTEEKYNI